MGISLSVSSQDVGVGEMCLDETSRFSGVVVLARLYYLILLQIFGLPDVGGVRLKEVGGGVTIC